MGVTTGCGQFLINLVGITSLDRDTAVDKAKVEIATFSNYRPPDGEEDGAVGGRFDRCNTKNACRKLDITIDAGSRRLHAIACRVADLAAEGTITDVK